MKVEACGWCKHWKRYMTVEQADEFNFEFKAARYGECTFNGKQTAKLKSHPPCKNFKEGSYYLWTICIQ